MVRSLSTWFLLAWPAFAAAQDCPPSRQPYFEFQVERPATFIEDSSVAVHPARQVPGAPLRRATLVSFIVDSTGRPDPASYKVIRDVDPGVADEGRSLVARWRYRPAHLRGCAVPQLVQTLLARK